MVYDPVFDVSPELELGVVSYFQYITSFQRLIIELEKIDMNIEASLECCW